MENEQNSPTSSIDSNSYPSDSRERISDWPPITRLLRTVLEERRKRRKLQTFFVKVHMEGIAIGRKIDLYAHNGYHELVKKLGQMFNTTMTVAPELAQFSSRKSYVLTYMDKEGDWMMVGDEPWELFITTVERLKIIRADKC